MKGFSTWIGLRDLPVLDADRQSTRRGVFVVGDLADAPIIKAAQAQGDAVGRHLAATLEAFALPAGAVDVVVVGGGPAGLAAAAALTEAGRSCVVVDRDATLHTLDQFPRGKMLYAEPRTLAGTASFPFVDGTKELVVATWRARVAELDLPTLRAELVDIEGDDGAFTVVTSTTRLRCRKVVLAVGRRGTPRRLAVPGGERATDRLGDPAAWSGRPVVVVGGGDSAVEAACSVAEAGASVTLLVRGARLSRPRPRNRARLEASSVDVVTSARLLRVDERGVHVEGRAQPAPADAVFALLGTELPTELLGRLGVRLRSDPVRELARAPGILLFAALVYGFYVLKQHRGLWPFGEGPLGGLTEALTVSVPWWPTADGGGRAFGPGFWGTLLYSALITGFGLEAMTRYRSSTQRRRYASLIAFQLVFLFGIPELLAPLITTAPAKFYALSVPWPLSVWSLAHEPAAWLWLVVGALVSFVAVPLYVARNNESFCSYLCGCGGLAETLGDRFRWRSPRGPLAKRAEWAGVVVLVCAVPVTLLVLNDLWGLVGFRTWLDHEVAVSDPGLAPVRLDEAPSEGEMRIAAAAVVGDTLDLRVEKFDWDGAWHPTGWIGEVRVDDIAATATQVDQGHYTVHLPDGARSVRVVAASSSLSRATEFAKHWYALMVDFGLASVVGVALYPWLGNRVWCRFFCPLRAYMELLSKRFGRLAIAPSDKCISCGECTRVCQMGIDVQGFAEQQAHIDNVNSACIQCGMCVQACPMGVLELVDRRAARLGPSRLDAGNW